MFRFRINVSVPRIQDSAHEGGDVKGTLQWNFGGAEGDPERDGDIVLELAVVGDREISPLIDGLS